MNRTQQQKFGNNVKWIKNILVIMVIIAGVIGIGLPNFQVLARIVPASNQPASLSAVSAAIEWSQEGHDAQRSGYTPEEPAEPWTLAWSWNGPDANGGLGGHLYDAPKDAHTVTGGSRVYVPAGTTGLFGLRKSDGGQVWHLTSTAFNASPAYDFSTGALFAGGADGILYKLDGATGSVLGTYAAGGALNKAVLLVGTSVYVQTVSGVLHKVNTTTMTRAWIYAAGANTATPAAYSANTGLVVYCTADLFVHAVRETDGTANWRVKPTSLTANLTNTFEGFWPVIAEQHGIVLVRLNLGSAALWSGTGTGTGGGGVYPMTNSDTRALLQSNNGALENLFALDLNTGSKKFIPAVGYGGTEYRAQLNAELDLVAPPVPVIKVLPDGSEVAYIAFRSGQGNVVDGRWDSHMGEMVLDNTTISGLAAGDLRFVDFPNSYVQITDEQSPLTLAGNTLFRAHWGASESAKILDRSAGVGITHAAPITSQAHPTVIRRQQACSNFNPVTHFTTCGLTLLNDGRYWNGPGFWTFWNVLDPPPFSGGAYSMGHLPRYTYVSDGLIYVEGNGGDLMAFRYSGGVATPTPTSVQATSTRTVTSLPATATRTSTLLPPTATRAFTTLPPTATKTVTPLPATATKTAAGLPATATKTNTALPTAATSGRITLKTFNDFSQSCAVTTNTHVNDQNGGNVVLAANFADHFDGVELNKTSWRSGSWSLSSGGSTQTGSLLSPPNSGYVRSKGTYTHGMIETIAQFGVGAWQHIGFGSDSFSGDRYFLLSTYNGDGNLYARVNNSGAEQRVSLGAVPTGLHRYRIEWYSVNASTDQVSFFMDGIQKAQMTVSSNGASNWYVYISNSGTAQLLVDQIQVTPLFATSGTYTTCALDAGTGAAWQSATWTSSMAAGTSLTLQSRTSANGTSWGAWSNIVTSGNTISSPARFVQFQVTLGTTNAQNTPALISLVVNKTAGTVPGATSTTLPVATQTAVGATITATTLPPTATKTPVPAATQTAVPPTATKQPTQAVTPTATTQPTEVVTPTATTQPGTGKISNVKVMTSNPAVYEKFEVQFSVQTAATNLDMPYAVNPPAGVQTGIGVTVNAEFSMDNWVTRQTQPAFIYQPYTHTVVDGKDHFTPSGAKVWAVRFAPQKTGTYQYRLTIQDSQGMSYYPELAQPALSVSVSAVSNNANTARGFLGVSPTDSRYFQFQDASPFIGVGFNDGFSGSANVEQKVSSYQSNQMNFMRVWLNGSAINGSQWTSWASNFLSQDGYLPGTSFDISNTYNGGAVSMRLDDANPCLYADFWQGGVPVEPNTKYQVSARIKVNGVTGPAAAGDYGFVIKQGGWLDKNCVTTGTGKRITAPVTGTSDWLTLTGSYTTGAGEMWLGNLYLARENATGGQIYIDEVHLYRADDPSQAELLRQPHANSVENFSEMGAAQWDLYIQSAQAHGVYLKLVIDEKNEWIRNHMGADGKMTATSSNDNFYAAPGTKVRWLEEAWWRYIIARWGYSTAIHSFEFINEGDPYNGCLYEVSNAMANYFHQNDPSRHMVTTSFWAAFPNKEFWSNPQYSALDYTDLHAYISTGWGINASFIPATMLETRSEYVHSGNGSAILNGATASSTAIVPRGLVLQGTGEWVIKYWMKASNLSATCPYAGSGSMMRLRWNLDGGPYNGGRSGVVPTNSEVKDYVCTSPNGTLDWTQFSSTTDRSGVALPANARLVLTDNNPHELILYLENSNGTGGTAWFDDIQVINPAGKVAQVIGQFDTTALDEDTAWYNQAYGEVFGGGSLLGARKPLVRGETGVDFVENQTWNPDLLKDTRGIWLHNNVWGQINAGGMYDLFWWATETIPTTIYSNFLTYQNFMKGIPLNNGHYLELHAQTSNAQLRVMGQRDDLNGRMHLWVQNTQHTWKRVVNGPAVSAVTGTLTIPNVTSGSYRVEWWNPYATSSPIILTQTVTSNGSLILSLPAALADDVALKIYKN